jgi:hypothetical protein
VTCHSHTGPIWHVTTGHEVEGRAGEQGPADSTTPAVPAGRRRPPCRSVQDPTANGKAWQQGDETAGSRVDADVGAAAQGPAAPLAEARRGGRYSPNRSTGLRAHSHYTHNELEERAKNAWYWTQLEADGFNTKSELVIAGMTLMYELLEEQYNDGQFFPPAPEQTRRGPSPAETARQSQAMRAYWSQRRTPDGQPAPTPDPASPASADPLTVEGSVVEKRSGNGGRGEGTSPLWGPEP